MNKSRLRTCKACGNQISRHSPFCRYCGHPQPVPLIIWALCLFLLLTLAFYVAFTIYGISHVQELQRHEGAKIHRAAPTACLAVPAAGPPRSHCPATRLRGGAAAVEATPRVSG